jgi:hypothetical protein
MTIFYFVFDTSAAIALVSMAPVRFWALARTDKNGLTALAAEGREFEHALRV